MAIKMNEVIEGTEETVGMRLRKARDEKEMSRREVQEQTNIPQKSLEKIEGGTQEPSLARVQTLCDLYGVTLEWVKDGNSNESVKAESADIPKAGVPKIEPANENDPMDQVRGMLNDLDEMRTHGFKGVQRGALALSSDILSALKHFEPGELLALASERRLHQCEKESVDNIFDLFNEDASQAQEYCGSIEERIVDTAMFGVDLYVIEQSSLVRLAENLKIEITKDAFFTYTWFEEPDHMEIIKAIRPELIARSVSGDGIDLENIQTFPRREE